MLISVIVPVHNGEESLATCLGAIAASTYSPFECIVVNDGSTDGSSAIARQFQGTTLELGADPRGPAHARNKGAETAAGDVLFFVDADVVIQPDTLVKVAAAFTAQPAIDALFGSYDEQPGCKDFISQYKNLFHHFVHQRGRADARTFWSGCGAIRRHVFWAVGGFDETRFERPSIEDIDLGMRLSTAGHKIYLDKEIQVKHLKRWTLRGLVKTDVVDRAIPWTRLILQERCLPNDLNLERSQRVSSILLCAMLLYLGMAALFHRNVLLLPLLAGLFALVIGYWDWSDQVRRPFRRMDLRVSILLLALSAAVLWLAVSLDTTLLLYPLAVVAICIAAACCLPFRAAHWGQLFFVTTVLAFGAALSLWGMTVPLWLTVAPLIGIFAILLINRRFYQFFLSRRGPIFTLSVIPFHLLYYLYSVVAFVLGAALFVRDSKLKHATHHGQKNRHVITPHAP